MAQTDPQSLLNQAACYQCLGSNVQALLLMELALLAQIVAALEAQEAP